MANEITKCPMCGTKLKMIDGRMTCKSCGYYIRNQNDSDPYQTGGSPQGDGGQTGAGQIGSNGTAGTNRPYYTGQPTGRAANGQGQPYTTGQPQAGQTSGWPGQTGQPGAGRQGNTIYQAVPTQVPAPKKKSGFHAGYVIIPVAACMVLVAIVCIIIGAVINNMDIPDNSTQAAGSSTPQESTGGRLSGYASDVEPTPEPGKLPQSSFFQEVAEAIWEKSYQSVTPEEYASLTAIQISRDDKELYYQLNYGETMTLTYDNDIGMKLSDLSAFPGLGWISVDDDLSAGDLDGLENLYAVYAENTFKEYERIIPNPDNITSLGVKEDFFTESLEGIENFPNLLYLTVEYDSLSDISALNQFPNLLGLYLGECNDLTDYSPLMTLTSLEELSIESSQLKTIEFIRQMPNLTSLSITDSQIESLDALEACPGLTSLTLMDNYNVEDYRIVGELDQLTELTLGTSWGGDLPSFEKLTQLTYLSLKYIGDLSPLKDATHVTYLTLEDCSGWELDALASMQDLVVLSINDFSSYVESLEPLTHLSNLAMLDLTGTSVFGNIEEIFSMPLLQLYLDDCQVGMDFGNIPDNDTLQVLSMDDITILKDPSYNNGDKESLSDHYDMFDHFPNLTELYVSSCKLDSIEFVEKLPQLQYLDITNNNVTSLKPLEQLTDFRTVWCAKNTILENVSESSSIRVIMND